MKLYIDTSNSEKIIIEVDGKIFWANAKNEKSQALLPFIVDVFEKHKLCVKKLTEIEFHTGPGSFTGLRVGASVSRALGFALGIPVNGKFVSSNEVVKIDYSVS